MFLFFRCSSFGKPIVENERNATNSSCEYDIDQFNCLNIRCRGNTDLTRIPPTLYHLINTDLQTDKILCSVDFRQTGITQITRNSIDNINHIYTDLVKLNPQHQQNRIKLSFSNLELVEPFDVHHVNVAVYIQNSNITRVAPKSLQTSSPRIELNVVASRLSRTDWLHLLDSANLRLLSLRNIPNLETEFNESTDTLVPMASITDVKVYNSALPAVIDNKFFLFRALAYVEQMELIACSIKDIRDDVFIEFSMTFNSLRILILTNNKLSRIRNHTFRGLDSLAILDLDGNQIELIETDAFNHLRNLRTLSLNGNAKILSMLDSPMWLQFYMFNSTNEQASLTQISLKSESWSKNFCLVQKFTNLNLHTLSDFHLNQNKTRELILFDPTEIVNSNVLHEPDSPAYCNFKFICHNQIYFSKTIWNLNMGRVCDMIKEIGRPCPFYTMRAKCLYEQQAKGEMRHLNSQLTQYDRIDSSLEAGNKSSTSANCSGSSSNRFWSIWSIAFATMGVVLAFISLSLGLFYYSYSKSKDVYDIEKRFYEDSQGQAEEKLMIGNTISDSIVNVDENHHAAQSLFGNDYYVFLLSKNQFKANNVNI